MSEHPDDQGWREDATHEWIHDQQFMKQHRHVARYQLPVGSVTVTKREWYLIHNAYCKVCATRATGDPQPIRI